MTVLANPFKAAIRGSQCQIGLWQASANAYTAEICAGAGFDWLLFDGEHGPNDIPLLLAQLQAVAGYQSHAVARPPVGDTQLIKQYLDIGVTTLLVPMVETADQAEMLVRAVRYPPDGVRGVGAGIARASRFNRIPDYLRHANDQICLLVQVETLKALEQLELIASVSGVDGVFIGPADLAAALGFLGEPEHPRVQAEIEKAITRLRAMDKPVGILTANQALARRYIELGCTFVAVGADVSLLARSTSELAAAFGCGPAVRPLSGAY